MAKQILTSFDLLALPSLTTPKTGSVGFGAKSDGLYQKIGTVESKLSTTAELLDRVKIAVPTNAKFTDTTYGVATTSANGLMSSADKTKLNGIATGANKYSLPTASSTTLGGVKIGSNISISSGVISVAAPYTHPATHPASMITGLHDSATTGVAGSVAWGNVTGKPSTFAPATHTHSNISITAGTGLSGGGALSATRTLSIASTYSPNTSTSLGASKNLNDYQTAGFYHQTANANATTALNYPVASAGALLVQTAAGVIQTYKVYNSSNVYVRGYYNSSWSAWRKLVTASDSIPWARITGAPATATTHPTWAQVTGKPSSFTPSSHSHSWSEITSKPSTFAPSAHTHTSAQISDATNLNTASMVVKRDSSGNFSAGTITASLSGKASSATKLATARAINGTSFDGTAAITTARWGSARNIGVVNSDGTGTAVTTSVNGSADVNLKLPATIKASLTGNASTATKLATARNINGTSFNGSANITTANWGTSRTLTVGNKGKSVNGSGNVSWSLSEIGALPIAGGTMTGILKAQNNTSYTTKQVRNIILSTADASASSMANGDIWIKYA